MNFVDQLDKELQVGDQIVQAYSVGSSSGLRRGVVVGFTAKKVRVQPIGFKRVFRRFSNPPPRGHQGEWVRAQPLELVSPKTLDPGHNMLIVNNEYWPELDEARAAGIII